MSNLALTQILLEEMLSNCEVVGANWAQGLKLGPEEQSRDTASPTHPCLALSPPPSSWISARLCGASDSSPYFWLPSGFTQLGGWCGMRGVAWQVRGEGIRLGYLFPTSGDVAGCTLC